MQRRAHPPSPPYPLPVPSAGTSSVRTTSRLALDPTDFSAGFDMTRLPDSTAFPGFSPNPSLPPSRGAPRVLLDDLYSSVCIPACANYFSSCPHVDDRPGSGAFKHGSTSGRTVPGTGQAPKECLLKTCTKLPNRASSTPELPDLLRCSPGSSDSISTQTSSSSVFPLGKRPHPSRS